MIGIPRFDPDEFQGEENVSKNKKSSKTTLKNPLTESHHKDLKKEFEDEERKQAIEQGLEPLY